MTESTPHDVSPGPTAPAPRLLNTLALAGLALGAGIWLSGRLERSTDQTFPGRLQARVVTITAEWPARLQEIRVQPGQRVAAGDPLFVLECEEQRAAGLRRRQAEQDRRQAAVRAKAAADLEMHWRRRELQAETFQTQLRLASLRQEKLHFDVEQVAWREQLSVKTVFHSADQPAPLFKYLSDTPRDVPEARVKAMLKEDAAAAASQALAAQITLCEQRLEELRLLDKTLDERVRLSHGLDDADAPVAPETGSSTAELEVDAVLTIASPSYGLIGQFQKQPRELVQAGEVLVQILDDDRRSIEVEVPSSAVARFARGQQVPLEFPGSERRLGIVSVIPPQTSSATGDLSEDTAVKLVVEPAGKLWPPVPIGSRVLMLQR